MSKCFLSFISLPNVSNQALVNVKKIHHNLVERLGEEAIKRHLQDKMDEIVVNLIKFVHDPDYFKEVLFGADVVLTEPESTHYSVEIMHSVFECLQVCFCLIRDFIFYSRCAASIFSLFYNTNSGFHFNS